jgi:hypothetical protein
MDPPQTFRFKVEPVDPAGFMDASALQGELNKHASMGWEFVCSVVLHSGEHLVFRRPQE